jgi:hypothetical protein
MNNPVGITKSSFHDEEATTEQQRSTSRKKKSSKKKKASKPGAVLSESADMSSKEHEDSVQQASSAKGRSGDGTIDEPGVKKTVKKKGSKTEDSVNKSKAEDNVKGVEAAKSVTRRHRSTKVLTHGAVANEEEQVAERLALESHLSAGGSKRSYSKDDESGVKKIAKKKGSKAKDSVNKFKAESAAKSMARRYRSTQDIIHGAGAVANEEEQVAEPLDLESHLSGGGSASKRSYSKDGASAKEHQASSRQSKLSRNDSSTSPSYEESPPNYIPVEGTRPAEAVREEAPGVILVKDIGASTHQTGVGHSRGGGLHSYYISYCWCRRCGCRLG